ncbi:MAG: ExeM/NucH family extracellular endonuclease, partial [Desulfobacteraceae bacterium]
MNDIKSNIARFINLIFLFSWLLLQIANNANADDIMVTSIHKVQGNGLSSPLSGQLVTVEGIVVGDFQNNAQQDNGDLNGFYLQEEAHHQDTDPSTSEGLFINAPNIRDVSLGHVVRVTGRISEFVSAKGASSQTQLSEITHLKICGKLSLPSPIPVQLPMSDPTDFERYEGMFICFPQSLTISEYYNFPIFGEIVLTLPFKGQNRIFQPTSHATPGIDAKELQYLNKLRRITLDDGRSTRFPDPAIHPNGKIFGLNNRFRTGDKIIDATGVLDHTRGRYRLQPTKGATYHIENPRRQKPEEVHGKIKVASFNVLHFFTTLNRCGAKTKEEFERQRSKIVSAIGAMDADIVGLNEIENNATEAIHSLVNALNDKFGENTYAYIDTGIIGMDNIKVALIYKPASVLPVGPHKILDASILTEFIDSQNRPALIQTFEENSTGQRFTVANNHFISKAGNCEEIGDYNLNDGQGNCNRTRLNAAKALIDYLATDPTHSGDPDILIIGDLNAHAMEDPITFLESTDYTNLIDEFIEGAAYSFVYDGQCGLFDYAFANSSLAPQITGTTIWHINSEEPTIFSYTTRNKQAAQKNFFEENGFRSSDHDP